MRIVVLGSSGFIGTHLVRHLCGLGHEVTGVARRSAGNTPGARFVQASIDDRDTIAPLLRHADAAIHLAWGTTPASSAGAPVAEATANLLPTLVLLEELKHNPDCAMLFVSTGGAIYAEAQAGATEDSPIKPRSNYGAAKASAEHFLHALHSHSGNPVSIVRPSNVYGPGQPARPGFGIVPRLMHCALSGEAFEIWGSSGFQRDYLWIHDFLQLIEKLLLRGWQERSFEVFNAASGRLTSIETLCETVETVSGRPIHRVRRDARSVDARTTPLDCHKAAETLDWRAMTTLETGLRETWGWAHGIG